MKIADIPIVSAMTIWFSGNSYKVVHINHRNVNMPSPLLPYKWPLSGPLCFFQAIFLMPKLCDFRGWAHFRQRIITSPWLAWKGEICLPPEYYRKWSKGVIPYVTLTKRKGRAKGWAALHSSTLFPGKISDWSIVYNLHIHRPNSLLWICTMINRFG